VAEAVITRQKDWVLTPEAFAQFLAALDADEARAAEEYEAVRARLIKLFRWRGVEFAEDCADETINRVARKLDEGERVLNVSAYVGGVARLVLLEAFKEQERRQTPLEDVPPPAVGPAQAEEPDRRTDCFESCLHALPDDARELILEYYGDEAGGSSRIAARKRMAARLGLEMNALRNRALRVRARLEQCIESCLGRPVV
jgi:DNA-directed RNA polymerase specialized sigma24 family protein